MKKISIKKPGEKCQVISIDTMNGNGLVMEREIEMDSREKNKRDMVERQEGKGGEVREGNVKDGKEWKGSNQIQ